MIGFVQESDIIATRNGAVKKQMFGNINLHFHSWFLLLLNNKNMVNEGLTWKGSWKVIIT